MPVDVWQRWGGDLVELLDHEIVVRDAEQLVTRVRTGFLAGAITDAQARGVLGRANLDPARIERYVSAWTIAASVNTRPPRATPTGQPRRGSAAALAQPAQLPAFSAPAPAPVPAPVRQPNQMTEVTAPAPAQVIEFPPHGGGRG